MRLNIPLEKARTRARTTRWGRVLASAVAMAASATVALQTPQSAEACGGTPPQPVCGKTLVFAKAAPGVLLLTGGGTFTVPTVTFLGLAGGIPPCPGGPYMATYTMTLTCFGGPGGGGTVTTPIAPGFNVVNVPVTVPAGPPRICLLVGTVTVTFTDGMVLSQTADQTICIVDPSPDDPDVPRLDLQHLSPETQSVHPGDQTSYEFLLTNNDPDESWTGTIGADMRNVAKLPTMGGPPPQQGMGVYAVSDPGEGDNFPLAFPEDLDPLGCVPLPPDPLGYTVSQIQKAITLAPGESTIVQYYARSWGMCADGSCGESTVIATGNFDKGDEGVACAGVTLAADTAKAPGYEWPDSGRTTTFCPTIPSDPVLNILGQPSPDDVFAWQAAMFGEFVQVFIDGLPLPAQVQPEAKCLDDDGEYGRLEQHIVPLDGQFIVDSFFDIAYRIDFAPQSNIGIELEQMSLMPGAPSGFEQVAPLGMGAARIHHGDFNVDSFFDITYQVSMDAIDVFGDTHQVFIEQAETFAAGPGFDGQAVGLIPTLPPNVPVARLIIRHDLRGFARQGQLFQPPCVGDIDGDGQVGLSDLISVLAAWGPCAGCPQDLDNSGEVGFGDLIIVLSNWGPC